MSSPQTAWQMTRPELGYVDRHSAYQTGTGKRGNNLSYTSSFPAGGGTSNTRFSDSVWLGRQAYKLYVFFLGASRKSSVTTFKV